MARTLRAPIACGPARASRAGGAGREPFSRSDASDWATAHHRGPELDADDAQLLAAVADGDRAALDQLIERHTPWLVLRLSRRCGDPGLVDEVVQDTFVRVWRKANTYRGSGEVGGWIWTIAMHRLLDHVRKHRPILVEFDEERAETVRSAEDAVLIGLEHGALGPAVNRLSPELRQVLRATVLDGLTTREAARLLGIPQGTVKTRLMRAKQQLREGLT